MSEILQGQTLLEIARDRGCSYETLCHMKDRRDIQPIGKRGRAALYNPADFAEKKQNEAGQQSADFRRRYEAARAEKLEISNAKARGDLIGRVLIARVFSEIYSIERSILLNIGAGMASTISAITEGGTAERTFKVQKIIDSEIYASLGAIKAAINKFLRDIEADEVKDDIPETNPVKSTHRVKAKAKPAAKKKKKPTG